MDDSPPSIEMLRKIPLFRGLEDDGLKAIANLSKAMLFREGESIVKEGDAGLGFYIIAEGQAVVKRKKRVIGKIERGGFFGEMALFDDLPRSAEVVATEPTKCFVILRWNFWSLVSKNTNVVKGLLREMARRLRATNEALEM